MKQVMLDLACLAPSTLVNDKGIGCAMGEVLFQAGVPFNILSGSDTACDLIKNHVGVHDALAKFLERPDLDIYEGSESDDPDDVGEDPSEDYVAVFQIEANFDQMMHILEGKESTYLQVESPLPSGEQRQEALDRAVSRLLRAGRALGVEFIIASPLELRGACRVRPLITFALPATDSVSQTLEPALVAP